MASTRTTATSPYESSFRELQALSTTLVVGSSTTTVTLPHSPPNPTAAHPYINSALTLLSASANGSHFDRQIIEQRLDRLEDKVGSRFDNVDNGVKYIHKRIGWVEDTVKDLKADVYTLKADVHTLKADVHTIKADVYTLKSDLKTVNTNFESLQTDFRCQSQENMAFQRNRLVRVLDAEIEAIEATVKDRSGAKRRELPAEFPSTVRHFWSLKTDIPALQHLAKAYSVKGWENWKSLDSDDAEATQYDCLDDAVEAHPERCHRALAVKWGLEYGQLEALTGDESRPRAKKRKADNEAESRRVRYKATSESELSVVLGEANEVLVKRRTVRSEEGRRVGLHTTLGELVRDYRVIDDPDDGLSGELCWSNSSTRARRHQAYGAMGFDPPDPDKEGRRHRIGTVVDAL